MRFLSLSLPLIFLKRWSAKQTQTAADMRAQSVRCLLCVEKACVNFLWQQNKSTTAYIAFNNLLKGKPGHVTGLKTKMPSVALIASTYLRYSLKHRWHASLKEIVDLFVRGLTKHDLFGSVADVAAATGEFALKLWRIQY